MPQVFGVGTPERKQAHDVAALTLEGGAVVRAVRTRLDADQSSEVAVGVRLEVLELPGEQLEAEAARVIKSRDGFG